MKAVFITLISIFILAFLLQTAGSSKSINKPKKKILPTFISVGTKTNDIYFYFVSAFKKQGIKIVSNDEARDLADFEMKNVFEDYFRNRAGDKADFEEIKRRAAYDLSYVVNKLYIKIKYDTLGRRVDSFSVHNIPMPLNIGSPYKSGWTTFDLSKTDTLPLSNFAEIMTDSIINAGILFREK